MTSILSLARRAPLHTDFLILFTETTHWSVAILPTSFSFFCQESPQAWYPALMPHDGEHSAVAIIDGHWYGSTCEQRECDSGP